MLWEPSNVVESNNLYRENIIFIPGYEVRSQFFLGIYPYCEWRAARTLGNYHNQCDSSGCIAYAYARLNANLKRMPPN